MIVLTGAAGFIGSCLLTALNQHGYDGNVLLVDDFGFEAKMPNWQGKSCLKTMHRDQFLPWFDSTRESIEFVLHIGARTDTSLLDKDVFNQLNLSYSQQIWQICTKKAVPLIYASSAATYGDGSLGFSDNHSGIAALRPLNPYADSKQLFDLWVLQQPETPPFWMGCKFFNVYGPNEYHKGRMASVIFHTFQQIQKTGKMRLFKSHRPEVADGHQSRDFVSVTDVVSVLLFAMQKKNMASGIYNLGSGIARTFLDLATYTFLSMDLEPDIEFIDTPEDIRDSYQYYTQADMTKLRQTGYRTPFVDLREGIDDYVKNYLSVNKYY